MKQRTQFKIAAVILVIEVVAISYLVLVIWPERDAWKEELDNYCISKGYDESTSRFLGNYAGVDVVHCRKEVVIIDENGIADLDIINNAIVFKGDTDK